MCERLPGVVHAINGYDQAYIVARLSAMFHTAVDRRQLDAISHNRGEELNSPDKLYVMKAFTPLSLKLRVHYAEQRFSSIHVVKVIWKIELPPK